LILRIDFFSVLRSQIESLKKEVELNNDSYQRMKKTYEEQIKSHTIKEKVFKKNSFYALNSLVHFFQN